MSELTYTIIVSTKYGMMMLNRHDINQTGRLVPTGVGFDDAQIEFAKAVCGAHPGALMLDIGANFGTYTLALSQHLVASGGLVHAFEPQREIANMICGSLALNSISNAIVHTVCVGDSTDPVDLPRFDYHQPMNFGSIEFGAEQREVLTQTRLNSTEKVAQVRIDDFSFTNVKFIKIDVEGMEEDVLTGAHNTFVVNRPIALVEIIKSNAASLYGLFSELEYKIFSWGNDILCIPNEDNQLKADETGFFYGGIRYS